MRLRSSNKRSKKRNRKKRPSELRKKRRLRKRREAKVQKAQSASNSTFSIKAKTSKRECSVTRHGVLKYS
jgi:hypothetical protein